MTTFTIDASKAYIKARVKQAERVYFRRFHAFTAPDIADGLRALEVRTGDCLFVHSAYDAFRGYSGKPTEVIRELQQTVGASGTLMMPTMPFTGTAVGYVRSHPVFDVRRTPSCMGLITELFRRSTGVLRSVHPTHPVAVWGEDSSRFIAGHHRASTPCGIGSPYMRLLERGGKIALLGTGIEVLTFYHALEEMFEGSLPCSPFTSEIFRLESRDHIGDVRMTETRLFEPAMSRRRNLGKLARELQCRGQWRQARAGGLSITVIDADHVRSAVSEMAQRGVYCYD